MDRILFEERRLCIIEKIRAKTIITRTKNREWYYMELKNDFQKKTLYENMKKHMEDVMYVQVKI